LTPALDVAVSMETDWRHHVLTKGSRPKIESPLVMPIPRVNAPVPLDTWAVPTDAPRLSL